MPPDARAQLAEQLFDSLEPEQAEIDAAWAAEGERRIAELHDGREVEIPHEQVMGDAHLKRRPDYWIDREGSA